MLNVKALQELIQAKKDRLAAIAQLATDEKREMSAEELVEVDAIQGKGETTGELGKLTDQLDRATKLEAIQKDIVRNRTKDLFDDSGRIQTPENKIVVPAQARKHSKLMAFKTPEDAYACGRYLQARFSEDDEIKASAKQWCRDHGVMNVATTGDNNNAGFLVPDRYEMPIIELRDQYGTARQECRIWPMAGENDHAPRVIGDLSVYFVGETEATDESDVSVGQVKLSAKELAGLHRISKNLSEDSMISVADLSARSFAYALAVKEDNCLFNGDGTSTYGSIVGLKSAIAAGSTVTTASGVDTFAELTVTTIQDAMALLRNYAGIRPKWFMNKTCWHTAFKRLAFAAGGNDVSNYSDGMTMQYEGYPVVLTDTLPGGSSTTDHSGLIFAYFGDLSMATTLGNRTGMTMETSTERYFEYRQIGLQVTQRFDINVHERGTASEAGAVIALAFHAS